MWGTGCSAASTPLASEMMTGIVRRSLQKRPICWKTGRISVEGRALTTISASHTASCRLVTTLRGQRGVSIMLTQNPSRRISSAYNVRSPNLASTYLRYAHLRIRRLNTSSRALMTSNRCSAVGLSTSFPPRRHIRICRGWIRVPQTDSFLNMQNAKRKENSFFCTTGRRSISIVIPQEKPSPCVHTRRAAATYQVLLHHHHHCEHFF